MSDDYKSWSTEKLRVESELIYAELRKRSAIEKSEKQKNLNLNGITPKDFKVHIWPEGDSLYYSFKIVHEGKDYDIYYDGVADWCGDRSKGNHWGYHSWWPIDPEEEDDEYAANGAWSFIPDGFSEAMENAYNYNGTKNQAIKKLKSWGITNIEED